jgi:hypothetical protein
MSREAENIRDPRWALAREKFFTLRPKPLERWLWQQGVPQSAERVFWIHWEEGMRRGDWMSELSLKQVARECALDMSTVTRSYQVLKQLGLVKREEPGRDPENPFRQLIAITEVRLPSDLVVNLSRYPNRAKSPPAPEPSPSFQRGEVKALMGKLSPAEAGRFHAASQARQSAFEFDAHTQLNPEERGRLLALLVQLSSARPVSATRVTNPPKPRATGPRKLSLLDKARVRGAVEAVAPRGEEMELVRQVLWSIEEGALLKFEPRMALNIALKKIREGTWTPPNRLPPRWLSAIARPETCSAA